MGIDFRRYIAVELASLLKSPWITNRSQNQCFEASDFVLIDKIVDSVNEYVAMCASFDILYPPPQKKEEEKEKMDLDKTNEQKTENETEESVALDPARQDAINQLLMICPDDQALIEFALDSLRDSAPNNVQVAAEWIFTNRNAWKKKKDAELLQESDAKINDDDDKKYYFKAIKKIEFNVAVKNAFYNDLKCDESIFCAPSYSEYFPLFCDIEKELMHKKK